MANMDQRQKREQARISEEAADKTMRKYLYGSSNKRRFPRARIASNQDVDAAANRVERNLERKLAYRKGQVWGLIVGALLGVLGGILSNYLSKQLGI